MRGRARRGIPRALAAFHLDKLVRQGLLDASYRRLTDRRGPGAGRPAKLYHRSTRQLDLTLPERRYELAGRVFARALTAVAPAARGALQRASAPSLRPSARAAPKAGGSAPTRAAAPTGMRAPIACSPTPSLCSMNAGTTPPASTVRCGSGIARSTPSPTSAGLWCAG